MSYQAQHLENHISDAHQNESDNYKI